MYTVSSQKSYLPIHTLVLLKWQCHEIFGIFFMNRSHLINMLKWFLLKIRFRGDIREISDSTQANTARSRLLKKMNISEKLGPTC